MYIVDFQVEGFLRCLYHVCHGEHKLLNGINFGGGEWKICHYFVEDIGGWLCVNHRFQRS